MTDYYGMQEVNEMSDYYGLQVAHGMLVKHRMTDAVQSSSMKLTLP